jgi:hypothetical protein
MPERQIVRIAAGVSLVAFLIYFVAEVLGTGNKSFGDFIGTVWGRVVFVDLGIGLAMIAAWIGLRERSIGRTAAWAVLLLFLGNAGSLLYVLWATRGMRESSDWEWFFLGRRTAK